MPTEITRVKDRRLVLLQFPEYQVDATALIEADIYRNQSSSLVLTSSGEYVDISGFLTRSDFRDYYFSMVTEKEFAERISKYSTTDQMDHKLAGIRSNYVSNSDLDTYKEELETKNRRLTSELESLTENYNNFIGTVLPGLVTNTSLQSNLDNYVTKDSQTTTLVNYLTINDYNTKMNDYYTKDQANTIKGNIDESINNVNKRFENYVTSNDFNTEINKKINTTAVDSKISEHDREVKEFIAEKYPTKEDIKELKSKITQGTSTKLDDYLTKEKFQEERDKLYSSTEVDNLIKDIKDTHYNKGEEDTRHNKLKQDLDDYKALNHTTHDDVKNYIKENNKSYNTKEEITSIKEALETSIGDKLDKSTYTTFKQDYDTTIQGIRDTASTLRNEYDSHIISFNSKSVDFNNKIEDRFTKNEIKEMLKSYYTKEEADLTHSGLSSSVSSTATNLSLLTNKVTQLESNKLDKNLFDDLNDNVLRTEEIEKRLKAINAYNKPEMDKLLQTINTSIADANRSINNLGTTVNGMYSNTILDGKFNANKTIIDEHTGKITALENNVVKKADYDEYKKQVNLSIDNIYSKSQIGALFTENNKKFYTKDEIDALENNKISTYDTTIKSYIGDTLTTRLGEYLSVEDFNTYKGDTATKSELTTKLAELSDSIYTKEEVNTIKDNTLRDYKGYADNKITTELSKFSTDVVEPRLTGLLNNTKATELIDDRIKGYVTKEELYERMSKIPSSNDLDSSIDSKMGEAVHTVRHIVASDVNNQLNKFYDYALDNKKMHYNKLALDSKFKQFQDRNLSLLRYKHTIAEINRVKNRFVNFFTKDEIDTKFNYYFKRTNIADATLYYTSDQTDKFLSGKLDTSVFRLFTDNVYGKQKIDTELERKVDISVYNTAIQGLTGRVSTIESNYNTVAGSINTLNTSTTSKFTALEKTVNDNNDTLTSSIGGINTKIQTIETTIGKFKTEDQLKNLIDSKIVDKVNASDYNLEKKSFVTISKLTTEINSVLDNTYTRAIIDGKISTVNNKIKSETEINSMIDTKLSAYSSSTDIENKIDTKVSTAKSEVVTSLNEETDRKLLNYIKTTDANNTYVSKTDLATKEIAIDKKITDGIHEASEGLNTLSQTVESTYLKLTGGELSGPLKVQKFKFSNEGILYDSNNLFTFKSTVRGSDQVNYGEFGFNGLDGIRIISKDGIYHYKDGTDYKYITTEIFDPFKADTYRKSEVNTLLDAKLNKDLFDTEIAKVKTGYVTSETLTTNINSINSKFDDVYTKQGIEKYVSDNYLKSNVFDTYKTNNKLEYEKHVRDELAKVNTALSGSISTLSGTVGQNKTDLTSSISNVDSKITSYISSNNTAMGDKVNVTDFNTYKGTVYTKTEVNKKEEDIKKLITASEGKITALQGNIPTLTSGKLDVSVFESYKPTIYTKTEVISIRDTLNASISNKANASDLTNMLKHTSENYIGKALTIGEVIYKGNANSNFKLNTQGLSFSTNGNTWFPIIRYENISETLLGYNRDHDASWTGYDVPDTMAIGRDKMKLAFIGEVFVENSFPVNDGTKYGPIINKKGVEYLINRELSSVKSNVSTNTSSITTMRSDCDLIKQQVTSLNDNKLDITRFRTDIANYVTTASLTGSISSERNTSDTKYAPKSDYETTKQKVTVLEGKIGNIDFSQVETKLKKHTDDKIEETLGEINKVLDQINGVVV